MLRRSRRIGQRVGEYRLVRALGRGGAGEVFAAEHAVIGSQVVIKLLRSDRAGQVPRGRLLGEARALALLDHPRIVKLLHASTLPDGTPYLVLGPLGGTTLRQRLLKTGGRLPPHSALGVLLQVAEALAYAHSQGVLHRDVKPENLIVQRDRHAPGGLRVTLIDFGLAKLISPPVPHAPGWVSGDTCLETADGAILGTPPYRAPEQGTAAATPALDIFSVGVLAWELLTGSRLTEPPMPADAATLAALHPELAPVLAPLVAGLLTQLPEQRHPQLAGFAAQLRELLRGRVPGATPRALSLRVASTTFGHGRRKAAQLFRILRPSMRPLLLLLALVAGLMWTLPHFLSHRPGTPGLPPSGAPGRAALASVLVLAQPQLVTISDAQLAHALPPGTHVAERIDIVPLPFTNPELAVELDGKQWQEASAAQEAVFRTRIAPRLGTPDAPRLAYFGMAPIPLTMHLGSLIGGLTPVEIYHHHRGRSDWSWDPAAAAPPLQIEERGVPTRLQRGVRTVLVRIATSFFIRPEDTRMILSDPATGTSTDSLAEIDLALAKPDPDALRSPEDIAEVAYRFRRAMDAVATYLPDVQVVHLFAAVPPGLALRLGMELRPNVHPAVQTYQFGRQLTPHYHAALLIKVRSAAAPRPAATTPSAPSARPPEEPMIASPKSQSKIEQRLERFVDWLKPDEKSEDTIRRQSDEIRQAIRKQASADGLIVRETPSAGSFAKNTGLRRHVTGGSAVEGQDVDLHFVLSPRTRDDEVLDRLLDRFYGYAQRAYPQRPPNKSRTKSSVTLKFVGTKLSYDLVPLLIAPEYGEDYQWLLRSDGKRLTSVVRHVEFTRRRTRRSNELPGRVKFNECVRLLKWWREFRMKNHRRSIRSLPSIVIDMMAAYAFDNRQVRATYSETLYVWFDFLYDAVQRRKRISFTDYPMPRNRPHAPKTPWMVIDPVDPSNNLTRNWIDQHVDELAGWLLQARLDLGKAIDLDRRNNHQESLHYLVQLLGPPFRTHCDPPAQGAELASSPQPGSAEAANQDDDSFDSDDSYDYDDD